VRLTAGQLNRATLARQLLLRRERLPVVDAVHRIVALQAQSPAWPYIALWNRLDPFDPADLDAAFASQAVLKATLMRVTLHVVDAADYPAFHAGMQSTLRSARLHDRRFTSSGVTLAEADALVADVVAFCSEPRSNADVEAMLAQRLGAPPGPGLWWALRSFSPLVHAPTGGPWSFGPRPAYVAAPATAPTPADADPDRCVQVLVRRCLEGFGPASAADVAQFAQHKVSTVRTALAAMAADLVVHEGPDGAELYDIPGASLPPEDVPAPPRLMAMWDSTLLAYADRSRVMPAEHRPLVIRRNGDVLPTLLVDGHVSGVWRPVDGGIEARAFRPLPAADWDGLAAEARGLLALLAARGPAVHRRHERWWTEMPAVDVRVL
jgi:DNA glycosylase AlkZ-like